LGSFLGHFRVIFTSFLHHFYIIFTSFLHRFRAISPSFSGHFWVIFGSFSHRFLVILGHFYIIFGSFFGHFLVISGCIRSYLVAYHRSRRAGWALVTGSIVLCLVLRLILVEAYDITLNQGETRNYINAVYGKPWVLFLVFVLFFLFGGGLALF
jgi:hypothetical protein